MANDVTDRPDKNRFELVVDDAVAVATYRIEGDRILLLHTEVPERLSGQGIGSKLAHGVFEALKTGGRKVVAECPFMASYASRHPEYAGMLDR